MTIPDGHAGLNRALVLFPVFEIRIVANHTFEQHRNILPHWYSWRLKLSLCFHDLRDPHHAIIGAIGNSKSSLTCHLGRFVPVSFFFSSFSRFARGHCFHTDFSRLRGESCLSSGEATSLRTSAIDEAKETGC
jgi:hypothetical protein